MCEDERSLSQRLEAAMAVIRDLPEPENEEQRQAVAGLNEIARVLGEMTASTEAFLKKSETEDH